MKRIILLLWLCMIGNGFLWANGIDKFKTDNLVEIEVYKSEGKYYYIGRSVENPTSLKEVKFLTQPTVFFTGDVINIDVEIETDTTLYVRKFSRVPGYNFRTSETPPTIGKFIFNTSVFMLNIGNQTPPISYETFKSIWFNNTISKITMEDYIDKCSWGQAILSDKVGYNQIVDLMDAKFAMPMSGKTVYSNLTYNVSKQCGLIEMYAFQEWAQKKFEEVYGNKLDQYTRRIVLLPYLTQCPWYGAGSQGCQGKYCYVWIRGDRSTYLNTYFHELGHTINLQHSSSDTWEYGDCSCAMGCSSDRGCYNAPTSFRAGWTLLKNNYTQVNPGLWYKNSIPAMAYDRINTIRIDLNWTTANWTGWNNNSNARYYLSLRTNIGYDVSLNQEFINTLSIHYSEANDIYDYYRPIIIANVIPGLKYNDTAKQLIISFTGIIKGGNNITSTYLIAHVKFCRYTKSFTTIQDCNSLLDSDCNGIPDNKERICK